MKRAVVPCAVLALLLFDSGVRADSCDVKLTDGSVAVWQGPCREGTPYGKGEVTHNGKTYKAVVEDRQDGLVQFSLDDDGRPAAPRVGGRHRDGNEPQRQAAGQDPRDSSAGSALAGGREENRPAEDTGAGAPPASAGARENFGFREYNAIGGDAESRDRGEPVEDEDTEAPPASTAARSPEPPAPGDAVTEQPAEAETAAAPCKLEVAGELLDWSGSCDGDGRASGDGNATAPDGTTYEGSAQNGQRHGFGTATTPAGNYYQGWFRNGVKHGKGVIRAADGEYYRTQFENGVEVGKRTPVEYATLGDNEQNHGEGRASRAAEAETDRWSDTGGGAQDDPWGPDTATAGSGAEGSGVHGSGGDVPSYVAVLGKIIGVLVPGAAAEDEYIAAVGTLERREAARREAVRREAERREAARHATEREAAAVSGRKADERPQRRAARRDAPERRRAAASNRNLEADRARQALRDRQRRSAEQRRKSQALLQRNLKIARLQRQMNEGISYCNATAQRSLNARLAHCGRRLLWCPGKVCDRSKLVRCQNAARSSISRERSQCEAAVRSAYRRSIAALLAQRY